MKNYEEISISKILLGEGYTIYDYKEELYHFHNQDLTRLHLYVKSHKKDAVCPVCGHASGKLHSTYKRTLQDLPIRGKSTYLHVTAYKYLCINSKCSRKVFAEDLTFAKANKQRTDALNQLILSVSLFMSNEGASRILKHNGISVSADSIQDLYDNITFEEITDVTEIGVDDVALRKGNNYATAIYSLKDHRLLALLEGRNSNVLTEWLKQRPNIKKICRDRANAYGSAITLILPECEQVADRFHLFQNLTQKLSRIFNKSFPKEIYIQNNKILENKPKYIEIELCPDNETLSNLDYDDSPPLDEEGNEVVFNKNNNSIRRNLSKNSFEDKENKKELIREVRKFAKENPNISRAQISRIFNVPESSVRRYLLYSEEQIDNWGNLKKRTQLLKWANIIYKMVKDNIDPLIIYYYIVKKRGYGGRGLTLAKYINAIIENNFPGKKLLSQYELTKKVLPEGVVCLKKAQIITGLFTLDEKKKEKFNQKHLELIRLHFPIAEWIYQINLEFHEIIMNGNAEQLDDFIDIYIGGKLKKFCNGLKQDIAAVKNAITCQESSGVVEGSNNKFKNLKRIVYGRSGLVNLRKKCLLAFIPDEELNFKKLV